MDNPFKSLEPALPLPREKPWPAFFTKRALYYSQLKNSPYFRYIQKVEIKYVTLVVGLLLSIGLGYLSHQQTARYLDSIDQKNLILLDSAIYSHIRHNLNNVRSLFALWGEKDQLHSIRLSRYFASPDFQSMHLGITGISSTYYKKNHPLQPPSAFLLTLQKDASKDGLPNAATALKGHTVQDSLQKFFTGSDLVFVYTSPLDGRFLALYSISPAKTATTVPVFLVHFRLRSIINAVLKNHPGAYNVVISTLGHVPRKNNKILYKHDFFSHNRVRNHVLYQNFVHNVGHTLWQFHYECKQDHTVLYEQTRKIFSLCLMATILFFLLAHRLTQHRETVLALAKKIKSDLKNSEGSLNEAQRIAHVGDWRWMLDTQSFTWSDEMFNIFQTDTTPKTLAEFLTLFDPADHENIKNGLSSSRDSDTPFEIECRVINAQQNMRWISLRGHFTDSHENREHSIRGVAMDIDERKRYAAQIQALAFRDPITGLSNRVHFELTINETLQNPDISWPVALIFIDLDGFKLINDSLGHTAGDDILRNVAERIQKLARPQDSTARISGDEFGLFLRELDSAATAGYIAERILATLAKPLSVLGRTYHITTSIGIAIAESNTNNFEDMLKHADLAMFRSKTRGRNTYQFYLPEMSENAQEQLQLAEEIRQAIVRKEFIMHYQPRLCLKTLQIVGAEALIRWQHPERGIILPEKFIYLAEEQGSIAQLGKLALEQACFDAVQWRLAGHHVRVAVNISAKQFVPGLLLEEITAVLQKTGLPAHVLELEITETSAMQNPTTACLLMQQAKSLGISLALDDFGTAYSSLTYLKRFPLNSLKIDRSFVSGLPHNNEDIAITRAVAALGHSMKLTIVAEGVEKCEQITCLQEWDIDEIQGYVIAQPMELKKFLQFLDDFRDPDTHHPEILSLRKHFADQDLSKNQPSSDQAE